MLCSEVVLALPLVHPCVGLLDLLLDLLLHLLCLGLRHCRLEPFSSSVAFVLAVLTLALLLFLLVLA